MGLGKTPTAITAIKEIDARKILIVCPAIVRSNWLAELDRWWPEHPLAAAILYGRSRKLSKRKTVASQSAYEAPIQVVSYALVDEVEDVGWDCIIIDEAHRLKNPAAKQAKAVANILSQCGDAAVFELTATLMPDQPKDVYNLLDLLWPERFGKKFVFWNRYANKSIVSDEKTGEVYGSEWEGVNQLYANELSYRLSRVSSRVTKAEVAHLLPPFMVQLLRIKGEKKDEAVTFESWKNVQEELNTCGEQKLEAAIEWAEDALESASHICILTHRRDLVRQLAVTFRDRPKTNGRRILEITGDSTPEDRNRALQQAQQEKSAIVVATMHSVGIGIDLTFCTQALFVELYYRPETVIQAIGRFSRLSGKVPSSVQILCVEGTADEIVAQKLLAKIDAINSAVAGDVSTVNLQKALANSMTAEESIEFLNKALESYVEDEYV